MYCVKCGEKIEDGELFCGACGSPVDNMSAGENKSAEQSMSAGDAKKVGKKSLGKWITFVIIVVVLLSVSALCMVIFSKRLSATTMRLSRFEGSITLTGKGGRELELHEDRRLLNGDIIDTGKESKAWVLLDEDRMVTIMERSSAEFYQSGKDLKLHLLDGSLFFNIERSLEEDESFNIETSTMIIGIRGTSGYADADEKGNSVLYLTSGKVELTGMDSDSGDEEKLRLSAGQKATIIVDDGVEILIEEITESDLPTDLVLEICADDDLLDEVTDETGWNEGVLKDLEEKYLQGEEPEGVTDLPADGISDITEDDMDNGDPASSDADPEEVSIVGTWKARNSAWPDIVFFKGGRGYLRYAPNSVEGFSYVKNGSSWTIYPDNSQSTYNCFFDTDGLYVTGWQYYDRLSDDDYYGEYLTLTEGPLPEDIIGEWYDPGSHISFYFNADGTVTGGFENGTWSIVDGNVIISQDYLRYKDGKIQRGGYPAGNYSGPLEDGYVWWDLERA